MNLSSTFPLVVEALSSSSSPCQIMEEELTINSSHQSRSDRLQDKALRRQQEQEQPHQTSLEKDSTNGKPAYGEVKEDSLVPPRIEAAIEVETSYSQPQSQSPTPSILHDDKESPEWSVSTMGGRNSSMATLGTATTVVDTDTVTDVEDGSPIPSMEEDEELKGEQQSDQNNNDSSHHRESSSTRTTNMEDISFSQLGYNIDEGGFGPDAPVAPSEDGESDNEDEEERDKKPWMKMKQLREKETTTMATTKQTTTRKTKSVHFEYVEIRDYAITIGDNPYCSRGVPITLDWEYSEARAVPIDLFESANKRRRRKNARRMLLDPIQRRDLLWRCGHELEDIEEAAKANEKENFRQSVNLYFLPLYILQEFVENQKDKFRRWTGGGRRKTRESEKSSNEAQVRQLHKIQLASVDAEEGGLTPWQQDAQNGMRQRPVRRVSFRGSREALPSNSSNVSTHSNSNEYQSEGEWESTFSDHSSAYPSSDVGDGAFPSSFDSKFNTYKIRTDPRQHDKATEIILCSIERPHMRAFHASWFGFFIGFVMWFAITPLLPVVRETLNLTNAEIWTSSLAGTAVTVLARVIMGPLCDVFGARKCMAAIVIVSAIPCGLTGLVNTASGLSAVRAFIGLAGSAFVPCQYWTSRMFAREVAGTANALVAGWGNLGGGVTQLLMGSALFPLFKLAFEDQENPEEMAWRTVFVVPSIIAFLAAYVYIFHCEDSPKGDFAELVRQQQIEIVSPFWSLSMAIQNRNVILLLVQYACCFGVEITMTNATALYMRDEFGQDTVAAAAIASVFGIMNLFARGLGGYGSDYCNSKYGTKGRVVWQSVTLFLEGIGIVLFAFAETLIGAIFSLIWLSLWVQCSEGSTYGIVPYVNRRFTGNSICVASICQCDEEFLTFTTSNPIYFCLFCNVLQELSWVGSVVVALWEVSSFLFSFASSVTRRLSLRWGCQLPRVRFCPSL